MVITATPFSVIVEFISRLFSGAREKVGTALEERKERKAEEFEIADTPPFETPLVAEFKDHPESDDDELEEEIDEESFDQEFTVEIPKEEKPKKPTRPVQLVLSSPDNYALPSLELLRTSPPSKGKSKANDAVVEALTEVFHQFEIDCEMRCAACRHNFKV